jgi:hypothetical protein
MTTKAKCLALAKRHNIEINIVRNSMYDVSVDIPEGYQLSDYDDRQGLTFQAENLKQVWQGVYYDLSEIITYKPWHKIATDLEAKYFKALYQAAIFLTKEGQNLQFTRSVLRDMVTSFKVHFDLAPVDSNTLEQAIQKAYKDLSPMFTLEYQKEIAS